VKCPVCGCIKFYVKDSVDEYETYGFECPDGVICFDHAGEPPEITKETETYCNQCSWHDKFKTLTKKGD